jgi:hypothetical protein
VRPGNESTGVVIQLVRVPFVRVSGKVAGIPRAAEQPIVMVEQEDLGTGVALKPDGSFETWRLGPGKYKLSGQWNNATGETVRTAPDEIEIAGSNIDNIVLRFVPESNIVGRLQFDDDQAKAFSQGGGPPRTVDLVESGEETRIVVQGPVGVDDTFHFDKIPAGKYRLALSWEDAWIRSMRLGPTTIDGSLIDLSNGSGGAELSLQLGAATGSVAGTVQSDGANSGATIVFFTGADNSGFAPRQVVAKPDGTYTIAHLPPGSYRVVAIEESDLTLDANAVEEFEDQMETVDVAGGARVTKNLTRRTPE